MTTELGVRVEQDFSSYVAARGAALQRFAHLVTGGATEAPDLVQDVLLRAWPRWDRLIRSGTVEAYLRRAIVNASVDRWRRVGRVLTVADPEPYMPLVEARDDAHEAWELCAELPPVQRAALVLRFHEDLSFAQVAEQLGCAESTARSHVHRAIRALRARLEESDE